MEVKDSLLKLTVEFSRACSSFFPSGGNFYIYNPLDYAFGPYSDYIKKYAGTADNIFIGMNPGPVGMLQTGIPFGEIDSVKNWLGISGEVHQPLYVHPKRPVVGFDIKRREPSGKRLWGFFKEEFGTPEKFFKNNFVYNYCPLGIFDEAGKNVTPDKLRKSERDVLFSICDDFLRRHMEILGTKRAVAIGNFAFERLAETVSRSGMDIECLKIIHPSPANPLANKGWAEAVRPVLEPVLLS
ncbi:MAG: uracil-DNA glycosylase family protein [Fibrobacterota bacterium]